MSTAATQQVTGDPEVAAYARQVREALADVPPARLEELLEDLEEHLVEVAAETPGPLSDRLGPAAEYADELRRAAGLPEVATEVAEQEHSGWRGDLRRYREQYGDHPAVLAVRGFLPELRPAWWVARAWAAVAAVEYLFVGSVGLPLPTLGLGVVGWALTVAAVVWSVRLGLRARAAAGPLSHRAAFADLALAVCALIAVIGLSDRSGDVFYPDSVSYDSGPTPLTHEDGTPITNIVPYGPDGEPLTGVLLYDQDGRPITNLSPYGADGSEVTQLPSALPDNAFPQEQTVVTWDEYGTPVTAQPTAPTVPSAAVPSAAPTGSVVVPTPAIPTPAIPTPAIPTPAIPTSAEPTPGEASTVEPTPVVPAP
ncbi:hypothetical protein [Modestobacter sp. Leaf380]|uniref:hypothetical protein n=1 Tax=Modestobacter sp. Leaf380 TaxID=1736356 RepID=UPI0006F8A272|nr:hypothetical protein [Modestobacter sp. Leaf380]KQS68411.1 hypothetical protein ASG41_05315 [Modestobacter sp. Leaf380]